MKRFFLLIFCLILFPLYSEDYTLGILYFEPSPGNSGNLKQADKDALSLALTEMMISDLSQLQILTLVDRENLNQVIEEQKLALSGLLDESTTARAGELLGAEYLMTGTLAFAGNNVSLSSRITDVESGAMLASISRNGAAEEIFTLQEEVLEELITAWDIPLSRKEWQMLAERDQVPLEGLIQLGNALGASDSGNYQQALTYLKQAVDLSPDFTLASSLLEEVQQRFDRFLDTRDKELPKEILDKIDQLSQGVPGAEQEMTKMYWAYLQPLMMGISYYGTLFAMDSTTRETYFRDYVQGQWGQMGLTEEPQSIEDMGYTLGRKIYTAQGILEYLLDKNIPLEGFNSYMHPVEGAMGYFLTLFASLSSDPDWVFPPMVAPDGTVTVRSEQYYPILLRYCDYFLANFPYSSYNGLVTPMMHNLLVKVES